MMKQDDIDDFVTAMEMHFEAHQKREHWKIIPCSEMSKKMKTIIVI
jgi:hypothetical protein